MGDTQDAVAAFEVKHPASDVAVHLPEDLPSDLPDGIFEHFNPSNVQPQNETPHKDLENPKPNDVPSLTGALVELPVNLPTSSPNNQSNREQANHSNETYGEVRDGDALIAIFVGLFTLVGMAVGLVTIEVPHEASANTAPPTSPSTPKNWLRQLRIISPSLSDVLVVVLLIISTVWSIWVYKNRHKTVIKKIIVGYLGFFLILVCCAILKLWPKIASNVEGKL